MATIVPKGFVWSAATRDRSVASFRGSAALMRGKSLTYRKPRPAFVGLRPAAEKVGYIGIATALQMA